MEGGCCSAVLSLLTERLARDPIDDAPADLDDEAEEPPTTQKPLQLAQQPLAINATLTTFSAHIVAPVTRPNLGAPCCTRNLGNRQLNPPTSPLTPSPCRSHLNPTPCRRRAGPDDGSPQESLGH